MCLIRFRYSNASIKYFIVYCKIISLIIQTFLYGSKTSISLFILTCMDLFQLAVNQAYFLQAAFSESVEKVLFDTLDRIVIEDDLSETGENGVNVIHYCINTWGGKNLQSWFLNWSSPVKFKLFSEKSIFSKFSRYLNNPKKLCFEDDELYVSPLFENSRYLVLDNPLKASLKKNLYDKLEQG